MTKEQKKPISFLFANFLRRTKLCNFFIIKRGFLKYRFYPSSVLTHFFYEKNFPDDDEKFFLNYLKKGDKVIDVGANIGKLSFLSSKIVGEKGLIYSFEPHPKVFTFLRNNSKLNKLKNIKFFNLGLGDKNSFLNFSNSISDDQNSIVNDKGIQVKVSKLDDIIDIKSKKIDLLKIDVEGYELFVLKGAKKLLKKVDCIYIESFEKNFIKFDYTNRDLLNFLRLEGFLIYKLDKNDFIEILPDYISKVCENLIAVKNYKQFLDKIKKL